MTPRVAFDPEVTRRMQWKGADASPDELLHREWLVTNGLGGYASGTVAGAVTRRYHGLLIAALPAPLGRFVMFNHLSERLCFGENDAVSLGAEERAGGQLDLGGADFLTEFRLDAGLPVWRYSVRGIALEKRILLPHGQNTVHVTYRILKGGAPFPLLELRPALSFRRHEAAVNEGIAPPYEVSLLGQRCEIAVADRADFPNLPPLRMRTRDGGDAAFTMDVKTISQVDYRTEESRGYPSRGNLWSPGKFHLDLSQPGGATLIASTEGWDVIDVLSPAEAFAAEQVRRAALLREAAPEAREGFGAELVFAADQFVITPAGRAEEAARAHAAGDEVRTVIAGYHWFTDWGRDTMISLEGLTLLTGRALEAKYILDTFSHYVRDGLIPNMFPEGEKEKGGVYNTADATLWYFHALGRYVERTGDRATLERLLPMLVDIVEHHQRGTRFHIHVDPDDGLLSEGADKFPLTWMDAHVGDWVVTPRRGKAVEINALWFNALSLLAGWLRDSGDDTAARRCEESAQRARESFNARFWNAKRGCLFDVVDGENGDDASIRPNQVFAISLPHPVLDEKRWAPVMDVVEKTLLTPVGLRSLAPRDPDYKPTYHGGRRSRDAAYHQGTVWPWLIGPFIDAWLRLHPADKKGARAFLARFPGHFDDAGLGTISEIFDAETPHIPRGCIAQAWSVAEVLRSWVRTAEDG